MYLTALLRIVVHKQIRVFSRLAGGIVTAAALVGLSLLVGCASPSSQVNGLHTELGKLNDSLTNQETFANTMIQKASLAQRAYVEVFPPKHGDAHLDECLNKSINDISDVVQARADAVSQVGDIVAALAKTASGSEESKDPEFLNDASTAFKQFGKSLGKSLSTNSAEAAAAIAIFTTLSTEAKKIDANTKLLQKLNDPNTFKNIRRAIESLKNSTPTADEKIASVNDMWQTCE